MRSEPHPLTGIIYEEQGDGIVKVENPENGKHGLFKWDGTWLEGDITYADPHLLIYVGGPNLPAGQDIYWGMSPPVYEPVTSSDSAYSGGGRVTDAMGAVPKVVAKYQSDEGKLTELDAKENCKSWA